MMPAEPAILGAMSLEPPTDFVKQQTLTRDAFLGGRLDLSQPRNGFRAGLDSVLLGASVRPASLDLLDLGAGVGTAALVAMTHNIHLRAVLAESDPGMAALAKANLADNGLLARGEVTEIDVTSAGQLREAAGLAPDSFTS